MSTPNTAYGPGTRFSKDVSGEWAVGFFGYAGWQWKDLGTNCEDTAVELAPAALAQLMMIDAERLELEAARLSRTSQGLRDRAKGLVIP